MSELDDVREQLVQRLEQGDALSGKEILAMTVGGMLLAAGLLVTAAGLDVPRSAPAIVVGLLLLAVAGFAFTPWLRRQRSLWRDVAALRRRERVLRDELPAGADPSAGILRHYYGRRLAPPVLAVASVAALLLVLRLGG